VTWIEVFIGFIRRLDCTQLDPNVIFDPEQMCDFVSRRPESLSQRMRDPWRACDRPAIPEENSTGALLSFDTIEG
jgi:hypothetical protein